MTIAQQEAAAKLQRDGKKREEIAQILNISLSAVKRRLAAHRKRERLDPELAARLAERGVTDLAGLHSGWLIEKDKDGAGQSLYFYLGPDEERLDFAEAVREALEDVCPLPPLQRPASPRNKLCNAIALADLHVGAEYGDPGFEGMFKSVVDDLVSRLPEAEKAVVIELGDLLDANDHKGVTPASGNHCDVIRENPLKNTVTAINLCRYLIQRLAERHSEVEFHLLRGNHDETAYIGVMVALGEHFRETDHVNIVVSDDEFRVVSWGKCAIFPHHGDKAKWPELKDVFADQFPDEWAAAKAWRAIWTAHFHHDRLRDLIGVVCEHFRTLRAPTKWAQRLGLFSRGSLTAYTLHKEAGPVHKTMSNIAPWWKGKKAA